MSASLFIGRYQPFHDGHKKLIESVLKKGKPVVVAIRATEINKENPYSIHERWNMIQKALINYAELVKIVVIPDIDEICYGRKVGYSFRKIDLDGKTEDISGTKIRQQHKKYPIFWLTGQTGAGKTTLANSLQKKIGGVILDGDEMRKSISLGAGFSKKDRTDHNMRIARLAEVLSHRSPVIVSVIAPFRSVRKDIDKMIKPEWIYVKRKLPKSKDKPYQIPTDPDLIVDSDQQSTEVQTEIFLEYVRNKGLVS